MLTVYNQPPQSDWESLLARPTFDASELTDKVKAVLRAIKQGGDKSLLDFTEKFDGVKLDSLVASKEEIQSAEKLVSNDLKDAISVAAHNIERFHLSQVKEEAKVETRAGVTCWRKSVGIEKVGIYIPGGTAPLFSTVLMLAIPAKIAGCKEVVLCSPPNKEGKIHPAILYAASQVGVTKIIKAGGAQAIAALAYGTESVPKVYKIFGPGNQFVTAAKTLVSAEGIAIDMPAGPSEVAVVADETANPAFVAADLLSQAEHGADSQVMLFANKQSVVDAVQTELESQLAVLPRKELAAKALEKSRAFIIEKQSDLLVMLNDYAPEHLILAIKNADDFAEKVINAGSVFIGNFTPESAGDYASGTNHTLPTNGFAKAYSGVSVDSFVKKITFQKITQEGINNLGKVIETMAEAEELFAHKNAVTLRMLNSK